jgi:hypothetical protein
MMPTCKIWTNIWGVSLLNLSKTAASRLRRYGRLYKEARVARCRAWHFVFAKSLKYIFLIIVLASDLPVASGYEHVL